MRRTLLLLACAAGLTAGLCACGDDTANIQVAMNVKPVARAKAPRMAAKNEIVRFDGSESSDADGVLRTFQWDFGDGTGTASTAIGFHAFNLTGDFIARLTVTDDRGESATATAAISIRAQASNLPPIARISAPPSAMPGAPVLFDATGSSDPDGSIVSYEWRLGANGPAARGQQVSHTFAMGGRYEVTLTVTDDRGLTATVVHTIDVGTVTGNRAPTADAGPSQRVSIGQVVMFDGTRSFDPDGRIVSYVWDFGDGSTGMGLTPTHVYNVRASFTVSLTVTDDGGLMGTDTSSVSIIQPQFDGEYSILATPMMQQCGSARTTWVATAMRFRTTGTTLVVEIPDPQMPAAAPIMLTGTLTGNTFSANGMWRDQPGGVHNLMLSGTFMNTRYTATMQEAVTFVIPLCNISWSLSGDKIN